MATKLDHLVQQIGSLPTLPSVIVRVNEQVANPKPPRLTWLGPSWRTSR
jgi:hypothetical protein